MEPVTGIEPARPAWEAGALPLSYTGVLARKASDRKSNPASPPQRSLTDQPDGVLLSDRDIRAEIAANRVVLPPWDPAMVQPSSVDVRLDKFFRLFDNHRGTRHRPPRRTSPNDPLVRGGCGRGLRPAPR